MSLLFFLFELLIFFLSLSSILSSSAFDLGGGFAILSFFLFFISIFSSLLLSTIKLDISIHSILSSSPPPLLICSTSIKLSFISLLLLSSLLLIDLLIIFESVILCIKSFIFLEVESSCSDLMKESLPYSSISIILFLIDRESLFSLSLFSLSLFSLSLFSSSFFSLSFLFFLLLILRYLLTLLFKLF